MTTDDILILAKAGFSAQQIAALSTVANATQKEPTTSAANATQNEPDAPVASVTAEKPETQKPETQKSVDPVLEAVNRLTGLVQAQAIGATQQPEHVETPEEILANIIAPKPKIKGA